MIIILEKTYQTDDVCMKPLNFFEHQLFSVVNGQCVGWALGMKRLTGEVRIRVEIGQQVVSHHTKFVTLQKSRGELEKMARFK